MSDVKRPEGSAINGVQRLVKESDKSDGTFARALWFDRATAIPSPALQFNVATNSQYVALGVV